MTQQAPTGGCEPTALTKLLREDGPSAVQTETGAIKRKFADMAPEHASAEESRA